jgi:hypothetical protein
VRQLQLPINYCYQSGGKVTVYEFLDTKQAMLWQARVNDIKGHSSALADDRIPWPVRAAKYREWMQKVNQFRQHYGNKMVPQDVESAYADVKAHV